jgi:hypothetical protein
MRAFVVAIVCSGALLSSAALADPMQTDSTAVPSATAQQSAAPAAAATATTAPMTATSPGAAMPAPAAAAAADASAVNLDEVVCRAVAAPTGSRLGGGRECHTVREWNQRERQSQDLTRQQERTGFAVHGG